MMSTAHMSRWPRSDPSVLLLGVAFAIACTACSGCQLAYFLTDPEREEKVKAEYGRIGGRKLAVMVWADQSTLDIYPRARHRVSKAVTYYMTKQIRDARFVDAEDVTRLQKRSASSWEGMTAREVCTRLKCDLLLRVELLEYTTRAGDTRELRKGRVRATVNLYEGDEEAGEEAVYEAVVVATYPPTSLHGVPDMDETQLLHETVELFAQTVTRKFYDHGVKLRKKTGH